MQLRGSSNEGPGPKSVDLRRTKAIFIASVGNPVEWHDCYANAAFALPGCAAAQPKFAAGFRVRPLVGCSANLSRFMDVATPPDTIVALMCPDR